MATYTFDREERRAYASAQRQQAQYQHEIQLRALENEKKGQSTTKNITKATTQQLKASMSYVVRDGLRDDEVGNEALKTKEVFSGIGNAVIGISSLIASVAAENTYQAKVDKAYDSANIEVKSETSYAQHEKRYNETLSSYQHETSQAAERLQTITSTYDTTLKEVRASVSDRQSKIEDNYKNEIRNIDNKINNLDKSSASYNDDLRKLNERKNEAQTNRDQAMRACDKELKNTINSRDNAIREAKENYAAATTKETNYRENKDKIIAEAQVKHTIDTSNNSSTLKTLFNGAGDTKLNNFVNAVNRSQTQIGQDLALKFGTKEEKELIQRVNADIKQEKQASKEGGQPHINTTTPEERLKAKEIVKNYAGSLNSKEGIQNTINSMNTAHKALAKENKAIDISIKNKAQEIANVDAKLKVANQQFKEVKQDKEALRTNKINGRTLTKEERAIISDRLKNSPNMGSLADKINKLGQEKTKLTSGLNKLKETRGKNKTLMNALKERSNFLTKNGEAILGAQRQFLNRKKLAKSSKKATQRSDKAINRIFKSVNKISRSTEKYMMKGDLVYKEMMKTISGADRMAHKYRMTINVSKKVMRVLNAPNRMGIKFIGKHTRFGRMMAERRKAKMNARILAGKSPHGHGKRLLGKFGNSILMAPATLLSAPMAIKNLPQTLAKKSAKVTFNMTRRAGVKGVRVAGKAGVFAVKKGAKLTKKGAKAIYKRTLGKSKTMQKVSAQMKKLKDKLKRMTGRVGKVLDKLNPFNLKRKLAQILTAINSAIASAIITIIGGIAMLFWTLILIIIAVIIILYLLIGLTSVITAIADWLKGLTAQNKSYVNTEPQYILNQAVNYRNAELDIFELFNVAANDKSKIKVNASPIYYTLYDNKFYWFNSPADNMLESKNNSAYNTYKNELIPRKLKPNYFYKDSAGTQHFGGKINNLDHEFKSHIKNYGKIKLSYYSPNALKKKSNGEYEVRDGQYVLKPNAQPSNYELSNAKEALALVDSLYSAKSETMQKYEVLAYLGVGDYQMANKGDNVIANNLFWATHKLIYKSGTKASDIWYHKTLQSRSNKDTFVIDNDHQYGSSNHAPYRCDNSRHLVFQYDEIIEKRVKIHKTLNDFSSNAYGEYKMRGRANTQWINPSGATANELYYGGSGSAYNTPTYIPAIINSQAPASIILDGVNRTINIHFVQQNSMDTSGITQYTNGAIPSKVTFFRSDRNEYRALDDDGNYLGIINIQNNQALWNLITTTKINNRTYDINKSQGVCTLDDFYILYTTDGKYSFSVFSKTPITNPKASPKKIEEALNGKLYERRNFQHPISTINAGEIKVSQCNHEKIVKETKLHNVDYYVCQGHIDLNVGLVVSNISDEDDTFFKEAMSIPPVNEKMDANSFLGLYTFKDEAGVSGWGSVDVLPYKPKEDWDTETGLRSLALAKTEGPFEYPIPEDKDVKDLSAKIKHYGGSTFQSLYKSRDKNLLLTMMFNGTKYRVAGFKSGEQKDIEYYIDRDGTLSGPGLLDLKFSRQGTPFAFTH